MNYVETVLGAACMLLILADVFLTILYARAGTGLLSNKITRATFAGFRALSKTSKVNTGKLLSFCGPALVVVLILTWFFGLSLGAGLIMHPRLGTSIRANNGQTQTDFTTALYVGGNSISVVGGGSYGPETGAMRMFFLLNSIIGTAVVSLTLTYLMQVYNALQRRNALGLQLHLLSRETGDAAELLAGLGPRGKFEGGQNTISELATSVSQMKEAHHFYPILFYFRFKEPFYSVSRSALTGLDLLSLLQSGLSEREYGWLKESAAVAQLWSASLLTLQTLEKTFLTEQSDPSNSEAAWRQRYANALARLQRAGIATIEDEDAGAERYLSLRREWDADVQTLGETMRLDSRELDPALARA